MKQSGLLGAIGRSYNPDDFDAQVGDTDHENQKKCLIIMSGVGQLVVRLNCQKETKCHQSIPHINFESNVKMPGRTLCYSQ